MNNSKQVSAGAEMRRVFPNILTDNPVANLFGNLLPFKKKIEEEEIGEAKHGVPNLSHNAKNKLLDNPIINVLGNLCLPPKTVKQIDDSAETGAASVGEQRGQRSVKFQDPVSEASSQDDESDSITAAAKRFLAANYSGNYSAGASFTSRLDETINEPISDLTQKQNKMLLFLCVAAVAVTYNSWERIQTEYVMPLHAVAFWLAIMFLEGFIISQNMLEALYKKEIEQLRLNAKYRQSSISQSASTIATIEIPSDEKRRNYLLKTMSMTIAKKGSISDNVPIPFVHAEGAPNFPKGFYSCLLEPAIEPEISDFLLRRLLRACCHSKATDGTAVVPICKYRGLDIFLTDSPEDPIHQNAHLNKCGLRDVPTLVINLVLPWANLIFYFQAPSWMKNFDQMNIEQDDPDDIKAFKTFLKGDDEYRRQRFQFFPCLVDGPRALKLIAPPKKEIIGRATRMSPPAWYKENEATDQLGNKKCALMEVTFDIASNSLSRGIAAILRRYFSNFITDIAFVIDQPELRMENEPCCVLLGLCQLNRIDLTKCPVLPLKTDEDTLNLQASVYAAELGHSECLPTP